MPYSPEELKEISTEAKPGAEAGSDPQFTPVIDKNEKVLVRDANSALSWKNYRFEITFEDGTHQEFAFTAPDDGAAQKLVNDRMSLATRQKGTYKLSLVEAPKELATGATGEATISPTEKPAEAKAPKAEKAPEAKADKPK